MRRKHKTKNRPAQRDSRISILKTSPYSPLAVRLVPLCGDPYSPLDFKTSPAQRDSKMSNGRLSGVFCRRQGGRLPENAPAQQDSGISKLVLTPSPLRPLRLNLLSAQQNSGIFTIQIRLFYG